MESRNPKLHRSDMERNMPPRWGFSSLGLASYNDVAPPELKSGSSPDAPIAALIQQQWGQGEGDRLSLELIWSLDFGFWSLLESLRRSCRPFDWATDPA